MNKTEQENVSYDPKSFVDNDMDPKSFIDDETDESDRPDEPSDSLELTSELTFTDWEDFKSWLHRFASKEGFSYKIRTSETIQGVMRRATYECAKSGSHNPQTTSDSTKQRNAYSQQILCPWKLNVTHPKTGVVKVNSFNNEHNHLLIPIIQKIAPQFRKLTKEMLADIEKYVIKGRMDSFRQKHNLGDEDTPQMLQRLMDWKNLEPLWVVKTRLDPISRRLISFLWMSPTQRELYNLNLRKKLKGNLGSQFKEFHRKFYVCWNSLCEELFELRWKQLVKQYPVAVKYLTDTLYSTKNSWAVPWIRNRFTASAQSTQRIESINSHMHGKVDRSTSLCNLLVSINDHVKNDEHFEQFEIERDALPTVETDNEEISIRIREQEQDTRQILLRSLVSTIPMEAILEVWNGLVCRHFFCVGTYSRFATFHICMIPNRWYINPDVEPNDLLQQYSFIPVCDKIQSEDNIPFKNPITFQHFFSIQIDSHGSQPSQPAVNSPKAMYAELAGLSKKAIDCALKSDKQQELLNIFKAFIYDVKSGLEPENFTDVINPVVIKHKDVSNSNVIEDNNTSNIVEDFTNDTKGQKCSKCKQYGHYAKTCQNVN
ncbi:protein FAR1-RELATED SEQUENCE 11 isoform X2 [Rhizophagus irregularis DAOM 181602=DAOM 197198]|nr:protein FAR1-RELATED SEQUENCE 11 isoform X2 [Rhizophagus irregularis DAOM 181602=DAOM 197198]